MLTLYHSSLQAHCRKVRLMMHEYGLQTQLEDEPYWLNRPEFLYLNPGGDVPVLQTEEGLLAVGNYAITEYLLEASPQAGLSLLNSNLAIRCEIRRLSDWFDRRFYGEVTRLLVYERFFKPLEQKGAPDTALLRQGRQQLTAHLHLIDALTAEGSFLAGDMLTLADLSAAAQLSCVDYFGEISWSQQNLPHLRRWYAHMKSRPGMREILRERVRSFTPPPYYENPDF